MKKLFLVETTNEGKWEINSGFHLVNAKSEKEAQKIIEQQFYKTIHDKKVLSVKEVAGMMNEKEFLTIIASGEM